MMKVIISKREFLDSKSKICADNSSFSALRGVLWTEGLSQAEKWDGSREDERMDNFKHDWIRPRSIQNTHLKFTAQKVLGTDAVL